MIAAQAVAVQPNVFELEGYQARISYSTTSFAGVASLTYVSRGETFSFRGDQLKVERTQLGQMVTVTLASKPQAIGSVETLTLMIPAITVPADSRQTDVQTVAMFSVRMPQVKSSYQSQFYMPLCLAGTARQVDF
jgi:hypothetical protein